MILNTLFYKRKGITNAARLATLPVTSVVDTMLPFDMIYHPLVVKEDHIPSTMDFPYLWLDEPRYIFHMTELSSTIGNPRQVHIKPTDTKKTTVELGGTPSMVTIDKLDKKRSPIVVNYSFLDTYIYRHTLTTRLNRIYNRVATMIAVILNTATERTQAITIEIDDIYPDEPWIILASKKDTLWVNNNAVNDMDVILLELHRYMNNIPSWFDSLRDKDVMWFFHHRGKLVLIHNSIFSSWDEEADLTTLSNGLVKGVTVQSPTHTKVFIHKVVDKLVTSVGEDEIVDEEVEVPVTDVTPTIGVVEETSAVIAKLAVNNPVMATKVAASQQTVNGVTAMPLGETKDDTSEQSILHPTVITTLPPVVTVDMTDLTAANSDRQYVTSGLYKQDITNAIKGVQRAGVIITNIAMDEHHNAVNSTMVIKVGLQPIDGTASTITVQLPIPNEDGTFLNDGNIYRMRKQKMELPIRKVSPVKVVCNSYYGTLFIERSTKMTHNITLMYHKVIQKAMSSPDSGVTGLPVAAFDPSFAAPALYSKLAMGFTELTIADTTFMFDHKLTHTIPGYDPQLEILGRVVVGYTGLTPIVMLPSGELRMNDVEVPSIATRLNMDTRKIPTEQVTIKVLGEDIPLAIFLATLMGLDKLVATVANYSISETKPIADVVFRFKNGYMGITETDVTSRLLLNGLLPLSKLMLEYDYQQFNTTDIYQLWLSDNGMPVRYLREIQLLDAMFIDDVSTRELLAKMGEPTEFKQLMLRACEMLTYEHHDRAADGKLIRVRGNERFAGFIYSELVNSTRVYRNTLNMSKRRIDMSPWAVLGAIQTDNSTKAIEETNPIQYTKDADSVTWGGAGGRTPTTIAKEARSFDENDVGFMSEAATDSGDVGMVSFLAAAAKMEGVRGMNASTIKDVHESPASCYSVSYMLAPGIDKDHMPRVSFASIQNTHNIAMAGAETPYVRTGYEYVLAYRVGKKFAWMASQDGTVTSVSSKGIIVKYVDGTTDGCALGDVSGKSADKYYVHSMVTMRKKGETFKKDDHLAFNKAFFRVDDLYPDKLCYTHARYIPTAFIDDLDTFEDSCALSSDVGGELTTPSFKHKSMVIDFNKALVDIVEIGETVAVDTVLAVTADEITKGVLTATASESLVSLTANALRSGTKGVVADIQVLYNGPFEDMHPTLQKLVTDADARRAKTAIQQNQRVHTGKVDNNHRVQGSPMSTNTVEIQFFILKKTGIAKGDKFVFGNQLKATVSRVVAQPWVTTHGVTYQAKFSYRAALARIVQAYQDTAAYTRFMYEFGLYLANKVV